MKRQSIANKLRRWRDRAAAIEIYGGKCIRCGRTDKRLLDFHHVNHDGKKYRDNAAGVPIASWLRRRGYPQGVVELLCIICHRIEQYDFLLDKEAE